MVGKSGYIGRSILEYLDGNGYEVKGIGRSDTLPDAFSSDDCIINCACAGWRDGLDTAGDFEEIVDSNTLLPIRLHKRRNGAAMIHLASGSERRGMDHIYPDTKRIASNYLYGKAHVLFLFTVFGGKYAQKDRFMQSLMRACRDGTPYTIITPNHSRDFVHIDKLISVVESLLENKDYKTVQVGSGVPTTFWMALEHLRDITGRDLSNVKVDYSDDSVYRYCADSPYLNDTLYDDMSLEWKRIHE